ncbi:MAG TPA: hypothetical protein VIX59_13590 [Candidatus Binataceae bacterium]
MNSIARTILLALLSITSPLALAGCFSPPTAEPPDDSKVSTVIPLPYDLAWDAVNNVIKENDFKIQAQDPNHGVLEVAAKRFSLQDADCGKIHGIAGTYAAEPELDGSVVYNFSVKPKGNEASRVEVLATFDSPLKVPLHRVQDVECVSRGVQESRLLQQILAQVKVTHRPFYQKGGKAPPETAARPQGRPSLLRPEVIRPDLAPRPNLSE